MFTQESKKRLLLERFDDNYLAFQYSLRGFSRSKLFDSAKRIAVMTECYDYVKTTHEWDDEDGLDYFLLFRDPLTIIADLWQDFSDEDAIDLSAIVWDALNNSDERILADYPRAKDFDALYDGII